MATQPKDGDTVIIKKYANRRLYNTRSSSYITLDHLSKMTREGVEYKVLDAKTGPVLMSHGVAVSQRAVFQGHEYELVTSGFTTILDE